MLRNKLEEGFFLTAILWGFMELVRAGIQYLDDSLEDSGSFDNFRTKC